MSTRINNKKKQNTSRCEIRTSRAARDSNAVNKTRRVRSRRRCVHHFQIYLCACVLCVCVCVYRLTEMPFFFCCFVFFRFFVLLSRSRRRTLFCFFEFARQKFDRSVPLQRRRIHSSHRKKKTKKKTKNWRQRIEEEESWVVPFSFRLQVSLFISL